MNLQVNFLFETTRYVILPAFVPKCTDVHLENSSDLTLGESHSLNTEKLESILSAVLEEDEPLSHFRAACAELDQRILGGQVARKKEEKEEEAEEKEETLEEEAQKKQQTSAVPPEMCEPNLCKLSQVPTQTEGAEKEAKEEEEEGEEEAQEGQQMTTLEAVPPEMCEPKSAYPSIWRKSL